MRNPISLRIGKNPRSRRWRSERLWYGHSLHHCRSPETCWML